MSEDRRNAAIEELLTTVRLAREEGWYECDDSWGQVDKLLAELGHPVNHDAWKSTAKPPHP